MSKLDKNDKEIISKITNLLKNEYKLSKSKFGFALNIIIHHIISVQTGMIV